MAASIVNGIGGHFNYTCTAYPELSGALLDGERGRSLLLGECSPPKLTTAVTMDTLCMCADFATVRRRPESGSVEADRHCRREARIRRSFSGVTAEKKKHTQDKLQCCKFLRACVCLKKAPMVQ